jgi:tetratricopeptide (TPR) repeat protein
MNNPKKIIASLIAVLMLSAGVVTLQAQSQTDAIDSFNAAQELLRGGQHTEALSKFQETIRIATSVGSEANDIKSRAERQIPGIQLTIAGNLLNGGQLEESIPAFEKAIEFANQYNNPDIRNQSLRALPVIHLRLGNNDFNANNLDAAEARYRKALELNANYARAHYQIGLIERRRNNLEAAIEEFDRAILVALNVNDTNVENLANNAARDFLTFVGATQVENGRYREAVRTLQQSLDYDLEHADTYYRLAEAYNNLAMWDEAINAATSALRHESGGQVARAKIHFELGISHMNKGNTREACSAFRSASYGQFRAAAEHNIEHELNCN